MTNNVLSGRLRQIREDARQSREDLADKLGVHANTIKGYELGDRLPDIEFLIVFADKTGTDFIDLMRLLVASIEHPAARRVSLDLPVRPWKMIDAPEGAELSEAAQRFEQAPGHDMVLLARCVEAIETRLVTEGRPMTPNHRGLAVAALYSTSLLEGDLSARMLAQIVDFLSDRALPKAGEGGDS